jgi:hypothetical protein
MAKDLDALFKGVTAKSLELEHPEMPSRQIQKWADEIVLNAFRNLTFMPQVEDDQIVIVVICDNEVLGKASLSSMITEVAEDVPRNSGDAAEEVPAFSHLQDIITAAIKARQPETTSSSSSS